ncbi:Putative transposase [Legionella israelensis]|uniref:Transposase IS66 family protein n=5 Tax=Legionella israelensis TaxID=454 RepID=A0A0W0VN08_9GAMM|nr:IS66 family transposase [Legionella israelensis]KTD21432.1 Transposase IS66 family protein [Legionella israelensis]QBS08435.1 IS66 family transposase [Legionella israelensis]QBS08741.1 IS66 family transposase [Legionella israelensis]QBS09035.1 IS66 family transposase [Legionella israelensis]QBS09040.1 IS66 family transposase [Legionella israelensis]
MKQQSDLTVEQLREENARLLALLAQQESTIETLRHQLHLFRNARFGRKSEKGVVPEQMALQFDEAEPSSEQDESTVEPSQTETITYTRAKKGTGRKALPKSLPYVEQIHDLSDEEKHCDCGCELTHIGDDISEQLDVVPQMTFRVVHVRKKYACKTCEETIQTAKLPKQPIPQSIASSGLLAAVIDAKFNRHMPLYRQEAMFKEAGIPVTRATLCNWVVKAADLLTPLVKLMVAAIHDYDIAYADETPVQVLKQKNKPPTSKSYMWLFIGGPPDKRCYVYQYHPSRTHQIPADFFSDFSGYLHADCYGGYVALDKEDHVTHVACMAHARRYFVDVVKLAGKKKGIAHKVLTYFTELYQLEASLKEAKAAPDDIYQARQKEAKPILDELKDFVEDKKINIPPKSPLGKAVHYLLTHWVALKRYLDDGRLEIDNNRTERSIKPFVIGRKNWLFHGNETGAKAGAILYSLIETCKQHQVDAFAWLKYALTNIQYAETIEQLEALLPFHVNPSELENMRSLPALEMPEKSGVN